MEEVGKSTKSSPIELSDEEAEESEESKLSESMISSCS